MSNESMTLYQSAGSPNSRRVRLFLAETGISIPLVAVDLGQAEQHSAAYRAINPRRVVPTLVLGDGTSIGEVPVILQYIDAVNAPVTAEVSLLGKTPKERALISMWERRAEQEGFASVMEAVRNTAVGLKGRAIAGPHDYEQIPALIERSKQRVSNFFSDMDARLKDVRYIAGDSFSVADITALVTADFAAKAINMPIPDENRSLQRWYDEVSSRPSASA